MAGISEDDLHRLRAEAREKRDQINGRYEPEDWSSLNALAALCTLYLDGDGDLGAFLDNRDYNNG